MRTRTASSKGPGIGSKPSPATHRSGLGIRRSRAKIRVARIVLAKAARADSVLPRGLGVISSASGGIRSRRRQFDAAVASELEPRVVSDLPDVPVEIAGQQVLGVIAPIEIELGIDRVDVGGHLELTHERPVAAKGEEGALRVAPLKAKHRPISRSAGGYPLLESRLNWTSVAGSYNGD